MSWPNPSNLFHTMLYHLLPQLVLTFLLAVIAVYSQGITLKQSFQPGDFKLVSEKLTADIVVSPDDFKVVQIAANDLSQDVEAVTGKKPPVFAEEQKASRNIVLAGTLGKNALIDGLVKSGKIDVSQIRGKWENYLLATVKAPFPNVDSALLIVGSDRRATAYGIYELSQMIGVSPWHWWADVTPEHKDNLIISGGRKIGGVPSVKYRGIFLNDEDWGLQPWAAKTFEPETGNIGPKTYAKICELLLRLKANTLWPAMHEVSTPFNAIPANRQVADDYAIVMGSSHAEPMLRNNVGEWKAKPEEFNFITNPTGVTDYWEQRVKENGKFENVYTIGMRGIHDSAIQGPKTQAERIPLLEKIFALQRGLLSKYDRPEVETIPQIFCPYKEVLADYRAGLKVPDDVTIVFPDDNFGYIRQFPNAEERKRKGGFGVYYHISYLGRPLSYVWLNSTPPAQIFEEMSKAYNNGMRQIWIANVGDIKPGEIGMEFFLQMAYDADRWNLGNVDKYLENWAKREFGERNSNYIRQIMEKYYRLGFQRKPEHLQWYLPGETPRQSDLSDEEINSRIGDYRTISYQAEAIYENIPQESKAAYYQLVLYPVKSAALANERYFAAELAERFRSRNSQEAIIWAKLSAAADAGIKKETTYYNETLSGGKWKYIMSPEMNPGQWPSMRSTPPKIKISDFDLPKNVKPVETSTPATAWPADTISIEAEHFTDRNDKSRCGWMVIHGLGKTGDSVSVFPNAARTFTNVTAESPSLEYSIIVANSADFTAEFYLLPTQPLVPGNGLRIAFSVDDGQPQIVTTDKDTEVSSPKWARNILNESTVGSGKIHLEKGRHVLRLFAVDTGVVVDKIVLSSGEIPVSYFGPPETLRVQQ
ncbi:glycosyl hydrolase 115 family protein [soil metagenome]